MHFSGQTSKIWVLFRLIMPDASLQEKLEQLELYLIERIDTKYGYWFLILLPEWAYKPVLPLLICSHNIQALLFLLPE